MDRREICKLLYTIEQVGFFDYKDWTYHSIREGGGAVGINIKGWSSNLARAWNLQEDVRLGPNADIWDGFPPTVLESLRLTYLFLKSFDPGNWRPYNPERLIAFTWTDFDFLDFELTTPRAWPLDSISLHDIVGEYPNLNTRGVVVQGEFFREWTEKVTEGRRCNILSVN
jgi:hypothetical protein